MTHGGKRIGAGRSKGSNKYGESTRPLRIPISRIDEVKNYLLADSTMHFLPLFSSSVRAGLPTTAEDTIEDYIDLNRYLSKSKIPNTTFLVRAAGDSMINVPIFDGDMLVVERDNLPTSGKIIIAAVNGELTVKRLLMEAGQITLIPENEAFNVLTIDELDAFEILGVVTHIIHQPQ